MPVEAADLPRRDNHANDGRLLVLELQESWLDEFVVDQAAFDVEPLNGLQKGASIPFAVI